MGQAARDGARLAEPIEFLAPRDFAFGTESPAEFTGIDPDDVPERDDEAPRSGWLAVAAGLSLTALIVVGIVSAAPWDSPAAAPSPTTIPSAPPIPATANDADPEDAVEPVVVLDAPTDVAPPTQTITGLVFDPLPPGFAVRGAWSRDIPSESLPRSGWGEVYATGDATRTSGAWFSITLLSHRSPYAASGGTPVDLGGRVGTLDERVDGTLRLTAPIGHTDSTQTLTITSYGRTPEQLIALFDSIGIDDDRPQLVDDRPKFTDPSLVEGLELVASRATDRDLLDAFLWGLTTTNTYYSDGAGERVISVDTSPRDDALGRLAIGPVRLFADANSVPSTFTGEDLVLGVSPSGSDDMVMARWHSDDTTIFVRSNLALSELLELLPTLRQTTGQEWRAVQRRAEQSEAPAAPEVPATDAPAGST